MNRNIIHNLFQEANSYKNNPSKFFQYKALLKAIEQIKKHNQPIQNGQYALQFIPNIGKGIAKRIDIILQSNNENQIYENEIMYITGIGPSRLQEYNSLSIFTIEQLKQAIRENKVKTTHHINIGIKYYYDFLKKIKRESICKFEKQFAKLLHNVNPNLFYKFCGSYRRKCELCGDIDIVISHKTNENYFKQILDKLIQRKYLIDHLTHKFNKKYMGVLQLEHPCRIDIRYVNKEHFATTILYFTGSKNFNLQMRKKAISMNYKLNEYTLNNLPIENEKDIFKYLNIEYVEPKYRNI